MSPGRPLHVTLTGGRSGEYVVVEERPDGCLVIAPTAASGAEPAARRPPPTAVTSEAEPAARRPPKAAATGLAALLSRSKEEPATIVEALDGWGVQLLADESVREFVMVEIQGRTGFAAVTSERFIFVAPQTGPGVAEEHRLTTVRDVELVRRKLRRKLRVVWDGSETLIGGVDQDALSRLQQRLADR